MSTLKELMGDKTRGDGRRFWLSFWEDHCWFEPIFKDADGDWCGLKENGLFSVFQEDWDERHWQEWTPPKETKKVKLYSPIGLKDNGKIYTIGQYANDKSVFNSGADKIVGWHEIEVEVT